MPALASAGLYLARGASLGLVLGAIRRRRWKTSGLEDLKTTHDICKQRNGPKAGVAN